MSLLCWNKVLQLHTITWKTIVLCSNKMNNLLQMPLNIPMKENPLFETFSFTPKILCVPSFGRL